MRLPILFLLALLGSLSHAVAQGNTETSALERALKFVADEDWQKAFEAAEPSGQVGQDIVEWQRLRAGEGKFADYLRFIIRNDDWPGMALLRRKGEAAIPPSAVPKDVLAYFDGQPPQTGTGALRLAEAYRATGRAADADALIISAWRTLKIDEEAQQVFLDRYATLLKGQHEARMDMLLWRGLSEEATRMLPLVSDGWKALAKVRMALRERKKGVDTLISKVPASLKQDPGLAYERMLWRFRKGRNADAVALLLERSRSDASLGRPENWANTRRKLARRLMREGKYTDAYRLASIHHLTKGASFADLEWLSGYISLRYLNDPARALKHFSRFRGAVSTPVSLGRAGYWEGRAYEALGDAQAARAAYALGAEYQTSFYGQLAAEKIGAKMQPSLLGTEVFPDWRQADFIASSVFRAALLLNGAGDLRLSTRFFVHLANSQSRTGLGQLGDLALALEAPYTALMIGKRAALKGYVLPKFYFPLHELAGGDLPIPPELAMAIARRESEFFAQAVSGAGARGLMQLMPGTANDVAKKLGLEYSRDKLLEDWQFNAQLGSAYLADLIDEYGPSYVLVSAGYNAGPSRPKSWIAERGDPRSENVDVIDWIEQIPFRETRNYVMRVMESLPVYRARLWGKTQPLHLSKELRGK